MKLRVVSGLLATIVVLAVPLLGADRAAAMAPAQGQSGAWNNAATEAAFQANNGFLYVNATGGGAINTLQGMAPSTSPSIAGLVGGGYEVAFQANNNILYLFNTVSGQVINTGQGMAPGTNPAIAALSGGGFEVAFAANNGYLYLFSSTRGPGATTQGIATGASPSIAGLSDGSYEIAFTASGTNNTLYLYSSTNGAAATDQGMAPGTNPGIAANGSGYEISFHAAGTINLYTYSSVSGAAGTNQGIAPGSSPTIAGAFSGGYQSAFVAAGLNDVYTYSPGATTPTAQGIATGTQAAITALNNSMYQVAFQAASGNLLMYEPSIGFGYDTGQGMAAGTSPSLALAQNPKGVAGKPNCGVPASAVTQSAKVILVSLACQELTAYQNGAVVVDTLVTTGRQALPTLPGWTNVLSKNHPFLMVSPWPPGTPYYYVPSVVQYVVWFRSGGYGIHDAYWEPDSALGPGSEFTGYSSHGCVHVPLADAVALYNWSDVGMPVGVF